MTEYAYDAELGTALSSVPTIDFEDILASRAASDRIAQQAPPADRSAVDVRDIAIPAAGRTISARVFTPQASARPLPLIYDLHGGGFCSGSIANTTNRDIELAREVEAVVVTVDYRLAPEHPYPAGLEDCYDGLTWAVDHAAELGVDTERVCVHGQSGGGGLAAALAILARDRGQPKICFQYLGVPEIDDRLSTPSMEQFVDTPMWNRANAARSWEYYLGDVRPGSDDVTPQMAPARLTDPVGLPPAYIAVMQFDPLRDEGMAYAQTLLAAGAPVELHLFPGTFHGSKAVASAEVSKREMAEQVAVLRQALRSPARSQ
jgi:acetyl esterase/lipase